MRRPRDLAFMEMAYGLAEKGRGRTSPNPAVGAVVVRGDKVVGRGFHERAGKPHAEILALREAGAAARGATLYLTLEPCVHWGRTPPCVDTVLAAGLRRVVVSAVDPNPLVRTRGLRRLRRAGLEVDLGLLAERNASLNEAYVRYITRKRPFVTLKAALTLDGRLASRTGDSRWITSPPAREYVHLLRGESDAIMIGAGTLLHDDPRLTVRHPSWRGKTVLRAVLDGLLRFPLSARMLGTRSEGPILVFAAAGASPSKARALRERGVEVVFPEGGSGMWTLEGVLAELGRREIASLLVEGGSRLFTSLLESRLADRAILIYGPLLVGGRTAPGLFGGRGADSVGRALSLRRTRTFSLGGDTVLEGYF